MPSTPASEGRHKLAVRLGYVAIILLATLSDLNPDPDPARVASRLARALNPSVAGRDFVDALRNVALFAGWGMAWLVTSPPGRERSAIRDAVWTGAMLSVLVEAIQLLSGVRTASLLDVLTNTGGALAGAAATRAFAATIRSRLAHRSFVGVPAFLFAGPYAAAVLGEALVPLFRQATLPGSGGGPTDRMRHALSLLEWGGATGAPWLDLLLFLPAGAFAVAMLAERGLDYSTSFRRVSLVGCALMLLAEVARGATGQPIQPESALVHCAAVVLGAESTRRWLPRLTVRLRRAARPAVVLAGYGLVLALWSWRPFVLEVDLGAIGAQLGSSHLIPLEALGGRVDLFSVADVAIQFLLYLPVGGLLAVWPLRHTGAWGHFLPGLYLAVLMEAGQIVVAGRFFDVTDLLIRIAGLWVGWVTVRRAGFKPYGQLLRDLPGGPTAPLRQPVGTRRR